MRRSRQATYRTPMKTSFTAHPSPLPLIAPNVVLQKHPCSPHLQHRVQQQRQAICRILDGSDDRLLVVLGPCSIHDPASAWDYAQHLAAIHNELDQELLLVMRVYLEKPRTTTAWKGFINDPQLNRECDINEGYQQARELLLRIQSLGVPCGTEFLHLTTPHYIGDLISWSAIGARTVNSPLHRELASDLPMPVGLKNDINGNISSATDAMLTVAHSHTMTTLNQQGQTVITQTTGNPYGHVILRGSQQSTNYEPCHITATQQQLTHRNLPTTRIMVDCSHGNSQKDHTQQIKGAQNVCHSIAQGNASIIGLMLESHLVEGRQSLHRSQPLTYGQSITDACINWETTENILRLCQQAIKARRHNSPESQTNYQAANT